MRVRQIWTNPDILKFCQRTGQPDPVEAIKNAARGLVARSEIRHPPFSPFLLSQFQRVCRAELRPIGFDACLIPVDGGYEVHICKDHSEARRNFSMAHELGHLLVMDPASAPKGARRETNIGSRVVDQEELLCDIAASELLFPTPFFEADAQVGGPSLSCVLELANLYKASIAATLRRFVESGIWKCFFLVWSIGNRGPGPKLKLDQIIANVPQPPYKTAVSIRDETRILTAMESRNIVRGREWLKFDDVVEDRYYLETIRIGSSSKLRLLSMVITEPNAGRWFTRRKITDPQLRLPRVP